MQARIGAQEHVLSLAQQLLDKEKVLLYHILVLLYHILVLHTQHTSAYVSRAAAARQGKGTACMDGAVCTSV
jgi:hypothetical protein